VAAISRDERDEASWQSVLATARDGIVSIDDKGRIILFNPMAERMFGYSAEEVIGANVSMLMPPPYRDEHDTYIRQYQKTRVPRAIGTIRRVEARRRSGEIFPIELAVSEAQTQHGVMYTAIVRDVTEQSRLQESVRRERDFATQVIETAQVVILILDPRGRIVRYNPYMEQLTGYPLADTSGRDWYSTFLPKAERNRVRHLFEAALRGDPVTGQLSSMLSRDGRELQIEWYARPLRGAEEQLIGLLCCGQDITEMARQRAEIEARVRQQATVALLGLQALAATNIETFLEQVPERVAATLDVEYVKILELLPEGNALKAVAGVGWKPDSLERTPTPIEPGTHVAATLTSTEPIRIEDFETDPRFRPSVLLRAHHVVSGIAAIIGGHSKPFGSLGAYTTKRRTFSEDDANFLQAVANVIAESLARERAEVALRENERTAQQRERLADIGAITARIVHDLGNPLAALSMQAQLILRRARRGDFTPREPVQQPTEQILTTLGRLEQLVREFTDFAREQRLNLAEVEVGRFLRNMADLWKPLAAAHGIELRVKAPQPDLVIRVDAEKIQRVLDNLIKNAIDAVARNGEVILRAAPSASGKVQILVEDSGSGIPQGLDVFRLFETTKPQGTGIGLAIAKQLVQAHGGTIVHRARDPHGTIFEIELPIIAASGAALDLTVD
jgi:PAS domain S-box-containing protein